MPSNSSNSIVYSENRLSYVGQEVYRIPSVLSKLYGNVVKSLDLSYNALTALDELRNFPHLLELVLDNNQLSDSLEFPELKSLHTLSLNKNNIKNLDGLLTKVEQAFPNLKFLSLLGNIACPNQLSDLDKDEADYQRYRYYVIYRLPGLHFLDSRPVDINERMEAYTRGKYMKIAKASPNCHTNNDHSPIDRGRYTPLPKVSRGPNDHQGLYGKCRYRYSNKNSEGNRFIRNHDL